MTNQHTLAAIQTIGTEQLAQLLGCSVGTIYNIRAHIKAGRLPANSLPPAINAGALGKLIRYRISTVQSWMIEGEATAPTPQKEPAKRKAGRPRKVEAPVGLGNAIFN